MSVLNVSNDSKNISLRRWRVMEIESLDGVRSRHVWGHDVTNNLGRSSSQIEAFDRETMTATTHSGKIYHLVGLPGNSKLGRAAWGKWCKDNGIASEADVTNDYLNVDQISTVGFEKIISSVAQ
ncbi:MAG: hypothetical protein HY799_03885 [Nitrosomonadales bacterium]|nr:hypothetical protein [Nitrosomonadales bacterium]